MRIEKIKATIKGLEIKAALPETGLILAPNGAGKTSTIMAAELAILGYCPRVAPSGNARNNAKHRALGDPLEAAVQFSDGSKARYSLETKRTHTPHKQVQELGYLDPEQFFELSGAKRVQYCASLAKQDITAESLHDRLQELLGDEAQLPTPTGEAPTEWALKARDEAKEGLKQARATLKLHRGQVAEVGTPQESRLEEYGEAKKERQAAYQAENAYESKAQAYRDKEAELDRAKQHLAGLPDPTRGVVLEPAPTEDHMAELQRTINGIKENHDGVTAKLEATHAELTALRVKESKAKVKLAQVEALQTPPVCPHCGLPTGDVPEDPTPYLNEVAQLHEEISTLTNQEATLKQERHEQTEDLTSLRGKEQVAWGPRDRNAQQQRKHSQAREDRAAAEGAIQTLEKQFTSLERPNREQAEALKGAAMAAREKEDALQRYQETRVRALQLEESITAATTEQDQWKKQLAAAEELLEEAVATTIEAVLEPGNACLPEGFRVRVSPEGDLYCRRNGTEIGEVAWSGGEVVMANIALAVAVAATQDPETHWRPVVLDDRLLRLDPENQRYCIEGLKRAQAAGQIDQLIVLSPNEPQADLEKVEFSATEQA